MLASTAHAAETAVPVKQYSFGLHTLNQPDTVRRKQVQFSIDSGMTEDELDSVNHVLDELGASTVDDAGNRQLTLANGTHVKIGGFLTEGYLEDSVEGVHSLPIELTVKDQFSTAEAALILRLAAVGHLFIGSSMDAERVATTQQVKDRRFQKQHKTVAITPDAATLVEWVQQNIAARDVTDEAQPEP